MTPTHQKVIDKLLNLAVSRVHELSAGIGGQRPERRLEELRASPLGQHLANLARYAEGYTFAGDLPGDIRGDAQYVSRYFFGDPLHSKGFRFPERFHKTELGTLINDALVRFYTEERPGQLLTMADMRSRFEVTRQSVHQWIKAGQIVPVYINNTSRFYALDVERLQARREEA